MEDKLLTIKQKSHPTIIAYTLDAQGRRGAAGQQGFWWANLSGRRRVAEGRAIRGATWRVFSSQVQEWGLTFWFFGLFFEIVFILTRVVHEVYQHLCVKRVVECYEAMTKFGKIKYDEQILNALRNDKLVVFAGAGVSMGAPSNLPSFKQLCKSIAHGTVHETQEPFDRFLGELSHSGVRVHELAARIVMPPSSAPNALHHNLLRLFRSPERIKLITTNFDLHFESAAQSTFGVVPETYRAPALPRGRDFSGIVYVHGALPKQDDLVLTDADFGRAYLTEGWARRFLLDVFSNYTVLFVGYSHNDVVMNYLARALPVQANGACRFALTENKENWDILGITPLLFEISKVDNAFVELYDSVEKLANILQRGALDWKSRMGELVKQPPQNTDEEGIGELDQALSEEYTTKFFVEFAKDPKWLQWLNSRKYFDGLFRNDNLTPRDRKLAWWLAEKFAIEHPEELLRLVAINRRQINPEFWSALCREVGVETSKSLSDTALKKWVVFLIAQMPLDADPMRLLSLAKRCHLQGCLNESLKIFQKLSEYRLVFEESISLPDEDNVRYKNLHAHYELVGNNYCLNEVWENNLESSLSIVALPLLSGIVQRIEALHRDIAAWKEPSRYNDLFILKRSAIEPHEQDSHPKPIDLLIDAARDSLEWMAINNSRLLYGWIEIMAASNASIIRRLAIHATTLLPEMLPDEHLNWILERFGLYTYSEHHEVYRAVALSFPKASDQVRKMIVENILSNKEESYREHSSEEMSAYSHFQWLSWLLKAKPDCSIASEALDLIKYKYPKFVVSDHPDLTSWMVTGTGELESPLSIEQLLDCKPHEYMDVLLNYQSNSFRGPSRDGLRKNVRAACKQNSQWALALASELAKQKQWSIDLWGEVIWGIRESKLELNEWREFLNIFNEQSLQTAQALNTARLLEAVPSDANKSFIHDLLVEANSIALSTWQLLEAESLDEASYDWLSRAINRPAGVIVEFWFSGLYQLLEGKSDSERVMPNEYREWFTLVVKDNSSKGGLGRTILASQTSFLFSLDETWTRQNIIPLFSDADSQKLEQVWCGFLAWGRLYPALVEALRPAFLSAMSRYALEDNEHRRRFIERYTLLIAYDVPDFTDNLLLNLFEHGSVDDWVTFADEINYLLGQMELTIVEDNWKRWLQIYWERRLVGIPRPLDDRERIVMLNWLKNLANVYPEGVDLAVQFPPVSLQNNILIYELTKSDLVTRFPTETARLLIYFTQCKLGHNDGYLAEVKDRLTQLPTELQNSLDEAFARVGLN